MKKLAVISAVVLLIATAAAFYFFKFNSNKATDYGKLNTEQQELFDDIRPENTTDSNTMSDTTDNLAEAKKINSQTVAWLTIPDTDIDFPIVQCEDNEHYLSYNFQNEQSRLGNPFLDYRCSNDFTDFNSIIYGHNIDNKYMFSGLLEFKNEDYFTAHPYGYLTLSDKKYRIDFIACDVVEYDSFAYNAVFLTDSQKLSFLKSIKENAVCQRDFTPADLLDSQICTLSTCSYEFTNARTVLFGKLAEM